MVCESPENVSDFEKGGVAALAAIIGGILLYKEHKRAKNESVCYAITHDQVLLLQRPPARYYGRPRVVCDNSVFR